MAQVAGYHGVNSDRYELAVVYDDATDTTDTIKLYMNGYTNAAATADLPNGWHSNGPLQVGRSQTADGWGEYLHGDLDDFQAYAGALRDRDINGLGGSTNPCLCG
ncbi:LamG-like jellyroll fold domain-containing protein [Streptomyces sp. NBC_01353]|uniref:LamG-like jellyroll fold domain-containing protein n=1 Tax=Streptomyces sp. NBC_01353 TaxID=2903835 RepID=UPI002E2EC1CC|nr:LamG-like jellyroll fold domain-containing protein [Streptomyces sp. NBC_01353]